MPKEDAQQSVENAIASIVTAIKDVLRQFKEEPLNVGTLQAILKGVFEGVKSALAELDLKLPAELPLPNASDLTDLQLPALGNLPPKLNLADWPLLCKLVWWPKDADHCASMRCAACATSILAASRACQLKNEGEVDHMCLRDMLGEGACNYCAIDYL